MRVLKLDGYTLYYGYDEPSYKYLYRLVKHSEDASKAYTFAVIQTEDAVKETELQERIINPLKAYINSLENRGS